MQALVPVMTPAPGGRLLKFVGDFVRFEVRNQLSTPPPPGWKALLRTNLGRASMLRREIIEAHTRGVPPAGAAWRDLPMHPQPDGSWTLTLPLAEPGFFKAKAYLVDARGWQHWPDGPDAGISVHSNEYRTANTIYCAFTRLFGGTKQAVLASDPKQERAFAALDESGYAVIPPSGKLRDLIKVLPHIFETLGCRILHLLPIHPTPATFARFGRYGSPYAALDLTAIDPALVVFDKRTTGIDQFRELTYESHLRGGRLFLDIVINHTGWSSVLHENRPDWFLRHPDGTFASPGAWGTVWEDLVELKHDNVKLWDQLASMFLTWCRRGVDGFRCDAAYKVPIAAWQYIVARVQEEYPETIFLAEGLGGAWEATEQLLTEGGMQWAYSELFQNYTARQVSSYLGYSHAKSEQLGLYVHYSETHDNDRLAANGKDWSLLRNRLCALTSNNGGFGFTCGVEWLAPEKINVHGCTGLAWDNRENIVPELAALNRLLVDHPCFFDGALISRLSPDDSPIYANRRRSVEDKDLVITLVNLDPNAARMLSMASTLAGRDAPGRRACFPLTEWIDLLGQKLPEIKEVGESVEITLPPGAAYCLSPTQEPQGLSGRGYREARARAAWGMQALAQALPVRAMPAYPWREFSTVIDRSPIEFLSAVAHVTTELSDTNDPGLILAKFGTLDALQALIAAKPFPAVVEWSVASRNRITLAPPQYWLLVTDTVPFRASLQTEGEEITQNREAIICAGMHIACFPPRNSGAEGTLNLERYTAENRQVTGRIRFLNPHPIYTREIASPNDRFKTDLVLLTNGRGGMARMCIDLGRIQSKYDCVLGANLHPQFPVDRHIFAKRIRVWVNADGFISPLNAVNLAAFQPGPPAVWSFVANAGDGRTVEIELAAHMITGSNTTVFRMRRPTAADASGKQLPPDVDVRLTVRLDIEDRNFHTETHRNGGAEYHFNSSCRPIAASVNSKPQTPNSNETSSSKLQTGGRTEQEAFNGFAFTPAADRRMQAYVSDGWYHPQPEWSENIPHSVEQSRAHAGSGDAFSPGWFEIPFPKGADMMLVVTAEETDLINLAADEGRSGSGARAALSANSAGEERTCADKAVRTPFRQMVDATEKTDRTPADSFEAQLRRAISAFVVRRDSGKTIIAGYPWFLDWGRDTFICARGLLAAGHIEDVKQIVLTFARFEKDGTLPNTLHGADASNRDTSDAPLWFALVCEELAASTAQPDSIYDARVDDFRTLRDVLISIAENYARGTPNGIRMDAGSGLIWSPSHFTWMDTNYPAATPREGYPIEIQALWVRLLRQLTKICSTTESGKWRLIAEQANVSMEKLFWLEKQGYYSDLLGARPGQAAAEAVPDDALRSNCLFPVALGLASGQRARRTVEAAIRHLVVPGALRTLAPLPVTVPLRIVSKEGYPLNDPHRPYWGRYEGEEDTRRKPAYHNGTAWCWTFPVFCEALARAWDFNGEAVAAARAYLGSMERLLAEGCIGQLPEIVEGDAPHQQRGCDAQAWSVTETLRVWKVLSSLSASRALDRM